MENLLIESIHTFHCLYDKSKPGYKNGIKRKRLVGCSSCNTRYSEAKKTKCLNAELLKVLDEYLLKHAEEGQDRLKSNF